MNKIRKYKTDQKTIIFAIPSYNEADSIGALTKVIDRGLSKYFKDYDAIIVNADNDSPDGTKQAFLKTRTKHEKAYLTSRGKPQGIRGKGYHIRLVFEYALKKKAAAVGFIDGDVTSASPEWVKQLIEPILKGYDHVLPIYLRNEYDGSITNHFVYPVLRGLLDADIRQPLAGEIAVSEKAIKTFLRREWYPAAYLYGVDIFLVTESIFHNHRMAQTFLGIKSHKPSAPKLDPMFLQVADSLLRQLKYYRRRWQKKDIRSRAVPILQKPQKTHHSPELSFDYKQLKESTLKEYFMHRKEIAWITQDLSREIDAMFAENHSLKMRPELWTRIVYAVVAKNKILSEEELLAFRTLFFTRFLSFYKDVIDKTHQAAERQVVAQTKVFKKLRQYAR